jgi:hypothetical protein
LKTQDVVILFDKPVTPYKEIGLVSSLGDRFTGAGDTYQGLQIAASQLGADGLIIQSSRPQSRSDYWRHKTTSGIAIKYATRYSRPG